MKDFTRGRLRTLSGWLVVTLVVYGVMLKKAGIGIYTRQTTDQIVSDAKKYPCRLVVITGGEPTMYGLDKLTDSLLREGFSNNLETSGSHPLTRNVGLDLPLTQKVQAPIAGILLKANELKIIVFNRSDFIWAEKYASMMSPGANCIFSPNGIKLV